MSARANQVNRPAAQAHGNGAPLIASGHLPRANSSSPPSASRVFSLEAMSTPHVGGISLGSGISSQPQVEFQQRQAAQQASANTQKQITTLQSKISAIQTTAAAAERAKTVFSQLTSVVLQCLTRENPNLIAAQLEGAKLSINPSKKQVGAFNLTVTIGGVESKIKYIPGAGENSFSLGVGSGNDLTYGIKVESNLLTLIKGSSSHSKAYHTAYAAWICSTDTSKPGFYNANYPDAKGAQRSGIFSIDIGNGTVFLSSGRKSLQGGMTLVIEPGITWLGIEGRFGPPTILQGEHQLGNLTQLRCLGFDGRKFTGCVFLSNTSTQELTEAFAIDPDGDQTSHFTLRKVFPVDISGAQYQLSKYDQADMPQPISAHETTYISAPPSYHPAAGSWNGRQPASVNTLPSYAAAAASSWGQPTAVFVDAPPAYTAELAEYHQPAASWNQAPVAAAASSWSQPAAQQEDGGLQ